MSPNCTLFVEQLNALTNVDTDDYLDLKLRELCELIEDDPDSSTVIPYIFSFYEAHPDADFGVPGSFVHFLEKRPDYREALFASVARRPIGPTVGMIRQDTQHRSPPRITKRALDLLRSVETNPQAGGSADEVAELLLDYQARRGLAEDAHFDCPDL